MADVPGLHISELKFSGHLGQAFARFRLSAQIRDGVELPA